MEELHAAIAAHLRRQRPATPPPAQEAAPAPTPPHTPAASFQCRFCARRVRVGDEGGIGFHFNELWEAVSCASCHRERLAQESTRGFAGGLRQDWYQAAEIHPRCQYCGERIWPTVDIPDATRLCQSRICAACRAERDQEGS